jgi:hypothetical protein
VRALTGPIRVDVGNPARHFRLPAQLDGGEHATFAKRLGERHPDVEVDYWGEDALRARLDTEEGKRVAATFFETQDAVELAERLLRAGSPLRGGEDMVDAEFAIGDAVAEAQPDFDWVIHRSRTDQPAPELAPGCVLRLALQRGDAALYADLVPRRADAGPMPGMTVVLDDSEAGRQARSWLDELLESGRSGRLSLEEGFRVQVRDIPAPFGDLVDDQAQLEGALTVSAVVEPPPFFARLAAGEGDDTVTFDVDLLPAEPPEEWDGVLEGHVGGLSAAMRFRWFVEEGRGEIRLEFHYSHNQAPHELEARVLRWLEAMQRTGQVTIEDRRGLRPPVTQALERFAIPAWLPAWARLHEGIAELEAAAGRPAPPLPSEGMSREQVRAILECASALRARVTDGDLTQFTADFAPGSAPALNSIASDVVVEETLVIKIAGQEMRVARQIVRAPPMIVSERLALPGGGWRVVYVPLGGQSAKAMVEFVPLSETTDQPS